jgi:hypothetical protein
MLQKVKFLRKPVGYRPLSKCFGLMSLILSEYFYYLAKMPQQSLLCVR